MTVREFIRWLETQDQDATVEVVYHTAGRGYYDQGGNVTTREFDPSLSDYTDFRGNQFVKPEDPRFDKRFLFLGAVGE